MWTHILAASATKSTGTGSSFLIIIVVFGALIIFLMRSQRRRQRATMDTQRQVMDGSKIRTTFGLYGTVMSGDDKNVMVEIAPGVQVKLLRQAIAAVVPDEDSDGGFASAADGHEKAADQDERTDLSI